MNWPHTQFTHIYLDTSFKPKCGPLFGLVQYVAQLRVMRLLIPSFFFFFTVLTGITAVLLPLSTDYCLFGCSGVLFFAYSMDVPVLTAPGRELEGRVL